MGELELPELHSLLNDVQPQTSMPELGAQRARSPANSSLSSGMTSNSSDTAAAVGASSSLTGGSCNSLAACAAAAGTGTDLGDFSMPDLDLALHELDDIDFGQLLGGQGLEELKQEDLSLGQGMQQQQQKLVKSNSLDSSTIALGSLAGLDNKRAAAVAGAAAPAVAAAKAAAKASKPRAPKPKKAAKASAAGAAQTAATLKSQAGGVAKPPRKLTITLKQHTQQSQQQQPATAAAQHMLAAAPCAVSAGTLCPVAEAPGVDVVVGSPDSGFSSACDLTAIPLSPLGMSEEESGSIGQFSLLDDVMADITFDSICGVEDGGWDDFLNL